MPCMNVQPRLPLPNPDDWTTRAGAASALGVDPATVGRMVKAGRLSVYLPRGGRGERRPALFWCPEVLALRDARKVAKTGVVS